MGAVHPFSSPECLTMALGDEANSGDAEGDPEGDEENEAAAAHVGDFSGPLPDVALVCGAAGAAGEVWVWDFYRQRVESLRPGVDVPRAASRCCSVQKRSPPNTIVAPRRGLAGPGAEVRQETPGGAEPRPRGGPRLTTCGDFAAWWCRGCRDVFVWDWAQRRLMASVSAEEPGNQPPSIEAVALSSSFLFAAFVSKDDVADFAVTWPWKVSLKAWAWRRPEQRPRLIEVEALPDLKAPSVCALATCGDTACLALAIGDVGKHPLHAIDARTGTVRWTRLTGRVVALRPSSAVSGTEREAFVSVDNVGCIMVHDAATGELLSEVHLHRERTMCDRWDVSEDARTLVMVPAAQESWRLANGIVPVWNMKAELDVDTAGGSHDDAGAWALFLSSAETGPTLEDGGPGIEQPTLLVRGLIGPPPSCIRLSGPFASGATDNLAVVWFLDSGKEVASLASAAESCGVAIARNGDAHAVSDIAFVGPAKAGGRGLRSRLVDSNEKIPHLLRRIAQERKEGCGTT